MEFEEMSFLLPLSWDFMNLKWLLHCLFPSLPTDTQDSKALEQGCPREIQWDIYVNLNFLVATLIYILFLSLVAQRVKHLPAMRET